MPNELRKRYLETMLRTKLSDRTAEEWLERACDTEQHAKRAVDSIGMQFLFEQSRLEFQAAELVEQEAVM